MNQVEKYLQLYFEKLQSKRLVISAVLLSLAGSVSLHVSYLIVNDIVRNLTLYTNKFTESDVTVLSIIFFGLLFWMWLLTNLCFYLMLRNIKEIIKRRRND